MLSPFARTGNYYGNVASNAIISGTVSALSGGKFANGAIMGAFRYMFNDALHEQKYKHIGVTARWLNKARDSLVELWNNGGAINNTPKFKFPKHYYRGMGSDMMTEHFDDMTETISGGYNGYNKLNENLAVDDSAGRDINKYPRYLLKAAKTQAEWMGARIFGADQSSYEYISGFFFDTQPTSLAGYDSRWLAEQPGNNNE